MPAVAPEQPHTVGVFAHLEDLGQLGNEQHPLVGVMDVGWTEVLHEAVEHWRVQHLAGEDHDETLVEPFHNGVDVVQRDRLYTTPDHCADLR